MGLIKNTEEGRLDPRLDKFYDETPQMRFTFQLLTTARKEPYELYYNERLDGDTEYNKTVFEGIKKRAQADMFNILSRLQSADEDAEFVSWRVLDERGQLLHVSSELKVDVKPQVGA